MKKPLIFSVPTMLIIILLLSACFQLNTTPTHMPLSDNNGDIFATFARTPETEEELVKSIAEPITTMTAQVLLCILDPDSCSSFSLNYEGEVCQEVYQDNTHAQCCTAIGTLDITLQQMEFEPDDLNELHDDIRSRLEEEGIPSLPEDIEWMFDESLKLAYVFIEKNLPSFIVQAPFVAEQCIEEEHDEVPKGIIEQRVRKSYEDLFFQCYQQPNCLNSHITTPVSTEIPPFDDDWFATPTPLLCTRKLVCTYTNPMLPSCEYQYNC